MAEDSASTSALLAKLLAEQSELRERAARRDEELRSALRRLLQAQRELRADVGVLERCLDECAPAVSSELWRQRLRRVRRRCGWPGSEAHVDDVLAVAPLARRILAGAGQEAWSTACRASSSLCKSCKDSAVPEESAAKGEAAAPERSAAPVRGSALEGGAAPEDGAAPEEEDRAAPEDEAAAAEGGTAAEEATAPEEAGGPASPSQSPKSAGSAPARDASPERSAPSTTNGRRIALIPTGSRGDVQPFVALGLALRRAGHEVLVIVDSDSEAYFKEYGLLAVSARGSTKDGLAEVLDSDAMMSGSLLKAIDAHKEASNEEEKQKEIEKLMQEFEIVKYFLSEFKPALMVVNTVGLSEGRKLEKRLMIPVVEVHFNCGHMPSEEFAPCHNVEQLDTLEPDTPVSALWANALMNSARLAAQKELELLAGGMSADEVLYTAILQGDIDTPEQMFDFWFKANEAPIPIVFAHSPHCWARPEEWDPEGIRITGNWKICKEDQVGNAEQDGCSFFGSKEDLERCQAFLAAGEPPVYIGWGSMAPRHPLTLSYLAMKALKLAGRRGIVVQGWSKLSLDSLGGQPDGEEVAAWARENVLLMDLVPHAWLMPQCACAVHHGGMGTCHSAIASGVPAVITPVILDQLPNAEHCQKVKLGLAASRLPLLSPEELAEKINACCADEEIKANCARVRDLMAEENGTENMVDFIGVVLKHIEAGGWKSKFESRLLSQETRRKKRLTQSVDAAIAALDRQVKQALPEYKKWAERQMKQLTEMSGAMKSESLFYVKATTGVVARDGEGLKTPELGRFKENAILVKLEGKGNRMKVKRIRGHGPDEGWVSASVSGKDVLAVIKDISELSTVQQALYVSQFGRSAYVP